MSGVERLDQSMGFYEDRINKMSQLIAEADAVILGIGAGMSAASGFTYTGERFQSNFGDFIGKYNFFDMLQTFTYPYEEPREYWAY